MARYVATSTVNLEVNGKQAQKMLALLKKDAANFQQQLQKASAAGDKVSMKKWQAAIRENEALMKKLSSETTQAANVMARLNQASPKELNKTLSVLRNQLNGIQRGTKAWDEHVAKIKAVKAEIRSLNDELNPDESLWEKLNNFWDKFQLGIAGAVAVLTGLVMAGRKAVNAYAEMEQEMANVRKFTGMTAEEVESLNEEFKKIDTRTSREELNQLAQEAGRLGKSSQEDVLGFVKAADKINVALDDLGSGATLTLSKLTGIFGDEERLGTEKALLSVGSVINELSQNCSASAPYIAEFASRMGGVGAQAGLTVQQIMGFAAVLDSNNQKLESSSTALSQVIVRIYQEPAKYAKVAGMDVERFSKLVKTDMNAALIEFLSTLKNAGGMDVLSPMFKDMGENGSRAISALATLASHIEDVKDQQIVANEAFEEATSIDTEFDVQNNTVQAGLEKAKNRVHELAVELGEKLQPVMRHVISSSTIAIKVLSDIVDFFIKYRKEVIAIVSAIVIYNATMLVYNTRMAMASKVTAVFNGVLKLCSGVVPALRLLLVPLINTVQYFTNGLQVNYAMQERWRKAMAAMKFSSWTGLVLGLATAVYVLANRWKSAREEEQKLAEERKKFAKEAGDISKRAKEYYESEISSLRRLHSAAIDETKSRDERISAANRLLALYPEQFKNFSAEEIMLGKAKKAYDDLTVSIINNAKAKAAAEKVLENEKKILDLELELDDARQKRAQAVKERDNIEAYNNSINSQAAASAETVTGSIAQQGGGTQTLYSTISTADVDKRIAEASGDMRSKKKDIRLLEKTNEKLTGRYKNNKKFTETLESSDSDEESENTDFVTLSSQKEAEKARKKAEAEARRAAVKARKEFKEELKQVKGDRDMAERQAIADRASGVINYEQYIEQMRKAEENFYSESAKVYEKWNLTEDADYQALLKKKEEAEAKYNEKRIVLNKDGIERIAKVEEQYVKARYDNKLNKTIADELAYQEEVLRIRYDALVDVQMLYSAGSKEFEDYQHKIDDLLAADVDDKRKKLLAKRAEFEKEFNKMTVAEKYRLEREALEELYKREYINEQEYQEWSRKLREKEKGDLPGEKPKNNFANAQAAREKYQRELATLQAARDNGDITGTEFGIRAARLKKDLDSALVEPLKECKSEWVQMMTSMVDSWRLFAEALKDPDADPFTALSEGISATAAVMSAVEQHITAFTQAQMEIQKAAIEKRYDHEISLAEGNAYLTKKLTKERDDELARMKEEASKKQFAMQVIATIAQTAANAVQAYGAGVSVGGAAGMILGPLAAALAVAQGMAQVAILKKQQQAAASTGYSSGGFTPDGPVDKPAGVVHAGEWVASQKLVRAKNVRPILDVLEHAQRTNRIGSITMDDVSRSVAAPMMLAYAKPQTMQPDQPGAVVSGADTKDSGRFLMESLKRLNDRLDEPFITHNSVNGPYGIRQAEQKYEQLIRNKSRKKRS